MIYGNSNLQTDTVKETSEYLPIPLPTVYYLVQRGKIPAIQIGGPLADQEIISGPRRSAPRQARSTNIVNGRPCHRLQSSEQSSHEFRPTSAATSRMPFATSAQAESRSAHRVTGLPPVGSAWSLPNSADSQLSTFRRIIGTTLAVRCSCRLKATFISVSQL
jgi:Helix-turn-helix domain